MFTNTITADQHRHDMLAQADADRTARAGRQGRPDGSRLRMRSVVRLASATAAAGAAAAALTLGLAGAGAQASVTSTPQVAHVHSFITSPPKPCKGSPC